MEEIPETFPDLQAKIEVLDSYKNNLKEQINALKEQKNQLEASLDEENYREVLPRILDASSELLDLQIQLQYLLEVTVFEIEKAIERAESDESDENDESDESDENNN